MLIICIIRIAFMEIGITDSRMRPQFRLNLLQENQNVKSNYWCSSDNHEPIIIDHQSFVGFRFHPVIDYETNS